MLTGMVSVSSAFVDTLAMFNHSEIAVKEESKLLKV